jgi:hypothetical protein
MKKLFLLVSIVGTALLNTMVAQPPFDQLNLLARDAGKPEIFSLAMSLDDLKRAAKVLILVYHPDKGGALASEVDSDALRVYYELAQLILEVGSVIDQQHLLRRATEEALRREPDRLRARLTASAERDLRKRAAEEARRKFGERDERAAARLRDELKAAGVPVYGQREKPVFEGMDQLKKIHDQLEEERAREASGAEKEKRDDRATREREEVITLQRARTDALQLGKAIIDEKIKALMAGVAFEDIVKVVSESQHWFDLIMTDLMTSLANFAQKRGVPFAEVEKQIPLIMDDLFKAMESAIDQRRMAIKNATIELQRVVSASVEGILTKLVPTPAAIASASLSELRSFGVDVWSQIAQDRLREDLGALIERRGWALSRLPAEVARLIRELDTEIAKRQNQVVNRIQLLMSGGH